LAASRDDSRSTGHVGEDMAGVGIRCVHHAGALDGPAGRVKRPAARIVSFEHADRLHGCMGVNAQIEGGARAVGELIQVCDPFYSGIRRSNVLW
jgi:hypothetical protein